MQTKNCVSSATSEGCPTKPMLVEFTVLDVSTAHLSQVTRELLADDAVDQIAYPKGDYGWFVHVPNADDGVEVSEHCPPDLAQCLQLAQRAEAHWVMFDADGTIIDELPVYDDAAIDLVA